MVCFCQIFQGLHLFGGLCLLGTLEHSGLFMCLILKFCLFDSSLILEFNHSELTHQKSRDEFYNLRTIFLVIPTSVVAWMEAFGCENYLRPIGGHAIYDLTIPVSSLVYFAIILLNQSNIDLDDFFSKSCI